MIEIKNLSCVYSKGLPTERQVLFDVSLEIGKGEIVALIGHTGSGKSTLIQHFNALIPPPINTVFVDGEDIADKKTKKSNIRKKVGLVFQYPEYQLFEDTVFEDISFGPKNLGLSKDEIEARVKKACSVLEIDEKYFDRSPFELSGGQKRRVAIAGVIAMEPDVLVLDEPVAGLDPKGRDGILKMILDLHERRPDLTIVFISHSMEDVAKVATRVIVMNKGSVAMDGSVPEIFSRGAELSGMGLSVPQITQIADKLNALGANIPENIYTVKYGAKTILELLSSKGGYNNV